jgi:hypothetical protein
MWAWAWFIGFVVMCILFAWKWKESDNRDDAVLLAKGRLSDLATALNNTLVAFSGGEKESSPGSWDNILKATKHLRDAELKLEDYPCLTGDTCQAMINRIDMIAVTYREIHTLRTMNCVLNPLKFESVVDSIRQNIVTLNLTYEFFGLTEAKLKEIEERYAFKLYQLDSQKIEKNRKDTAEAESNQARLKAKYAEAIDRLKAETEDKRIMFEAEMG